MTTVIGWAIVAFMLAILVAGVAFMVWTIWDDSAWAKYPLPNQYGRFDDIDED